jgi:hypothetical protein
MGARRRSNKQERARAQAILDALQTRVDQGFHDLLEEDFQTRRETEHSHSQLIIELLSDPFYWDGEHMHMREGSDRPVIDAVFVTITHLYTRIQVGTDYSGVNPDGGLALIVPHKYGGFLIPDGKEWPGAQDGPIETVIENLWSVISTCLVYGFQRQRGFEEKCQTCPQQLLCMEHLDDN